MKLKVLPICLTLMLLNGCSYFQRTNDIASVRNELQGARSFKLEGYGSLELTQDEYSNDEYVTIKTTADAMAHITTKIDGKKLTIHMDEEKMAKPHPKIDIRISVKSVDVLSASGAFEIKGFIEKADKLHIDLTGSTKADFKMVAQALDVSLSGSNTMNIAGQAQEQTIHIAGASQYNAEQLESSHCSVDASGSVSINLQCLTKIDGSISGASKLYYTGHPVVNVQSSGASLVKALN